jgi:hypothetical protein
MGTLNVWGPPTGTLALAVDLETEATTRATINATNLSIATNRIIAFSFIFGA